MNRFSALATTAAAVFLAGPASAAFFTLEDENSFVEIDTSTSDPDETIGVSSWEVDGIDHLFQQWFWYRTADDTAEIPLSALDIAVEGTTDTDFDGDDDTLFVKYVAGAAAPTFEIELRLSLQGGIEGSGVSDMAEQIKITNFTGDPLELTFFQYNDYDLNDDSSDDTALITNENAVVQTDGTDTFIAETVITPVATLFEIAEFSDTLDKLQDDVVDDLNGDPGPVFDDATWAFQWDFVIGPNSSVNISKDKRIGIIPEPATAGLLALGLGGLTLRRRR